jgi:hypothetical protein
VHMQDSKDAKSAIQPLTVTAEGIDTALCSSYAISAMANTSGADRMRACVQLTAVLILCGML